MEYLVAALVLLLTVSYAVFIAVSIEKGKSWAVETARAISMLDPATACFELRDRLREPVQESVEAAVEPEAEAPGARDRLAA
jgi:hypothetical protein